MKLVSYLIIRLVTAVTVVSETAVTVVSETALPPLFPFTLNMKIVQSFDTAVSRVTAHDCVTWKARA